MYRLEYDQRAAILKLHLTGFWTAEIMSGFSLELELWIAKLARTAADFVILSDCRDYPVQSAEIGAAWSGILGAGSTITAPYAVVVGSVLNKLQAERALTAPSVRVFTSMASANEWLTKRRAEKSQG